MGLFVLNTNVHDAHNTIYMAQFRGTLQGSRSEVSRLGHKKEGLTAKVNGWTSGLEVRAFYDEEKQQDVFVIAITGGSSGNGERVVVQTYTQGDIKGIFEKR